MKIDDIIGHDHAKQILISHPQVKSWLLSGQKGIGKATLAKSYANYLVENHFTNILTITDTEQAISIKQIRSIKQFLYCTSLYHTKKVVIIDSIDNINDNAANALLKTLEEIPLNSYIILITHKLYMVLQTIKSRCFHLKLLPLNLEQIQQLPDNINLDFHELSNIYKETFGLLNYNIQNIELYKNLLLIAKYHNQLSIDNIINTEIDLESIGNIVENIILKIMKENLDNINHIENWNNKWYQIHQLLRYSSRFHLDKKQLLLNIVNILSI